MLQGEIGLEIVVQVEIEGLTVPQSPVPVVSESIFLHLFPTQSRASLFVLLR